MKKQVDNKVLAVMLVWLCSLTVLCIIMSIGLMVLTNKVNTQHDEIVILTDKLKEKDLDVTIEKLKFAEPFKKELDKISESIVMLFNNVEDLKEMYILDEGTERKE